MTTQHRKISCTLALTLALAAPSLAKTISGKASYHEHTSRFVTAARGVPRGSLLRVTNPLNGRSCVVRVNDACGRVMRPRWGRVLDLSTGAFTYLYGGLKRGVGPVRYKLIKRGRGAMTGRF